MTKDPDDGSSRLLLAAARGEPLLVHGDVVAELRPTGVMGTLAQMTLTEIMQMMDFGKKTARVDVYLTTARGEVHVHDGQIVRATATTTSTGAEVYGEPAFLLLCREHEGFFRIHYARDDVGRNVQRPTTFVLLDALRMIDEAAAAAAGTTGETGPADDSAAVANAFDDDGWPGLDDEPPVPSSSSSSESPSLPQQGDELQHDPRFACTIEVDVDGDPFVVEDIGVGGAFVRTDAPRAPGSMVHLVLKPNDGPPLELMANVVHMIDVDVARQRGRNAGMGVRFDPASSSDSARDGVRRIVDQLAARTPLADAIAARGAAVPAPVPLADDVAAAVLASSGLASPPAPAPERLALPGSSMLDSIAEVDFLLATGDLKGAQQLLLQAHEHSPDDDDVRRRLRSVNEQIEAASALAFLQHAERALGKPESIEHARRATQLWPSREVILRALAVFAHARSHENIADAAGRLMELDPEDEGAMRTWLEANLELQRWNVAVRTAEALLRRRPGDEQLKKLLQRLVHRARAAKPLAPPT